LEIQGSIATLEIIAFGWFSYQRQNGMEVALEGGYDHVDMTMLSAMSWLIYQKTEILMKANVIIGNFNFWMKQP